MEILIFKSMREAIAKQLQLSAQGHKAKGKIEHKEDGTPIYKVEDHGKMATPNK